MYHCVLCTWPSVQRYSHDNCLLARPMNHWWSSPLAPPGVLPEVLVCPNYLRPLPMATPRLLVPCCTIASAASHPAPSIHAGLVPPKPAVQQQRLTLTRPCPARRSTVSVQRCCRHSRVLSGGHVASVMLSRPCPSSISQLALLRALMLFARL